MYVAMSSILRFLTYIGDLCVCQGQAIQKVQMMVCNVVLQDINADVLMKITYVHSLTNTICSIIMGSLDVSFIYSPFSLLFLCSYIHIHMHV